MPQGLQIYAQPSPLAEAFSQFTTQMMANPPEERAMRGAMARLYNSQADEAERQQAALSGIGSKMAELYKQQSQAIPQGGMGPMPAENPSDRAQRLSTGMADIFAQIGKDNAGAVQSGLATGQAFGDPDDMRRSMVLQGKEIGPDFSPTAGEGNRIVSRNSDLKKAEEKAKIDATPLTDGQFKGQKLAETWNTMDKLNPYQLKAIDALPSKGMSFTTNADGTVEFSQGGDADASGLTKPGTNNQQIALQANQELKGMVGKMRALVGENPTIVGPAGNVQRGVQTALDSADGLSAIFGSVDQFNVEVDGARKMAQQFGFSTDFDPALPNITKLHNLLLYKAASALAGQQGRAVTDQDIKKVKGMVGDPGSWFTGPRGYMAGLDLIDQIAGENANTAEEIIKAGSVKPLMNGGAAAPAAPAAGANNDAVISDARAAVAKGAPREAVLQRLQKMGITPPADF